MFRNLINIQFVYFAEPKCGFQIAFNMFDTDGNQRVDKNEFLVVSGKGFLNLILFGIQLYFIFESLYFDG